MSTVVAIDIGYGHVKIETRSTSGGVVREMFPSFATLGTDGDPSALENVRRLDQVAVRANGRIYLVGKDSRPRQHLERNQEPGFSQTDPYMALTLGALWHARRETIDLLVVGLPMNTLKKYSKLLKQKLTGLHVVPDFRCNDRGDGQKVVAVNVREVLVLGQPVGAFLSACAVRPDLKHETSLVLDMGFNTLDVFGMDDMTPVPERIGAIVGGISRYVDEISKSINARMKLDFPTIHDDLNLSRTKIERALCDDQPIRTGLGPVDIAQHRAQADALLEHYMESVSAMLGNYGDISVAVLAGGGATLVERAFRQKFPLVRNVLVAQDPQFSVVHGFLLAGEDRMLTRHQTAAHA